MPRVKKPTKVKEPVRLRTKKKAAVKIREPLAQRYLATVRRYTFAYEISPARKAGDEREYQFIEIEKAIYMTICH